ncbi:MAG: Holliday junction resolvase RecU [Eubacteriaceae bacterium]|nr:Holliday junction resolvase RecU [Eubacteriaceae bacterium]
MDAREYRNMIQGKVNKVQGKHFEDMIENACVEYKHAGKAYIEKNQEPFVVTRSLGRGQFSGHFRGSAQTDYTGVMAGGRTVCFEAKHTDTDRMLQSAVKDHQAEDLDHKAELGAICFVIVGMKTEMYNVPWQTWKRMKELFGHKYMNAEDLKPYKVPAVQGTYRFLEKIEEDANEHNDKITDAAGDK